MNKYVNFDAKTGDTIRINNGEIWRYYEVVSTNEIGATLKNLDNNKQGLFWWKTLKKLNAEFSNI